MKSKALFLFAGLFFVAHSVKGLTLKSPKGATNFKAVHMAEKTGTAFGSKYIRTPFVFSATGRSYKKQRTFTLDFANGKPFVFRDNDMISVSFQIGGVTYLGGIQTADKDGTYEFSTVEIPDGYTIDCPAIGSFKSGKRGFAVHKKVK